MIRWIALAAVLCAGCVRGGYLARSASAADGAQDRPATDAVPRADARLGDLPAPREGAPAKDSAPTCTCPAADINDDGTVDTADNDALTKCWQQPAVGSCKAADVNGDGTVGFADFQCVLDQWHQKCPVGWVCTCKAADINKSGRVDPSDLAILSGCWLQSPVGACAAADLNGDGAIDGTDLQCLTAHWQESCAADAGPKG